MLFCLLLSTLKITQKTTIRRIFCKQQEVWTVWPLGRNADLHTKDQVIVKWKDLQSFSNFMCHLLKYIIIIITVIYQEVTTDRKWARWPITALMNFINHNVSDVSVWKNFKKTTKLDIWQILHLIVIGIGSRNTFCSPTHEWQIL